jgi:uncharacterized protein (TIGR03083 family)
VELSDYLDALKLNGAQLVRSAKLAGLDARVPSCSDWTVRSLVGHTTRVHHWATSILIGADPHHFDFAKPDDDALFEVFESGLVQLIERLRTAPKTLNVWTFMPADSALGFWARRQAHETAIHAVDAQLAADCGVIEFDPAFAADGLGELLTLFAPSRTSWDDLAEVRTITVEPIDVNRAWTLSISGAGVAVAEEARDDSDLTVFGTASDLYLWAWNRADDSDVSLRGNLELASLWRRRFNIGDRPH